MDDFKEFVRKNPILISYVKNEGMTWQKFYEIYSLYGEDESVWEDYLNNDKNERNTNSKTTSFHDFIQMAKNMDVEKVQEGITSLQKAIGLFGDLFINNSNNKSNNNYEPRSIYRRFED